MKSDIIVDVVGVGVKVKTGINSYLIKYINKWRGGEFSVHIEIHNQ